jgi:L-ascorbate metabolism protein UlaG (beta-lactamase superfamily)
MTMNRGKVYLKPNVLMEPLFNQWYAWSNLISPATASMYIANLHVKIMQSFVSNPQVHIAALKNPANLGGPFINYDADRVNDIRTLLETTLMQQAPMLKFAEAIKSLDQMIIEEAGGFAFEPLYQRVPEILKGYVELVYDLNHHPSIRFIEGLLYQSPFYNTASQTVSLSLVNGEQRSFVFSTPRLERQGCLNLPLAFKHQGLDDLFKMRRMPRPFEEIKEILRVKENESKLFSTFFTEESSPAPANYAGDDVRIRYFGHACVLFETKDTNVLTDPVISYDIESTVSRYAFADLPNMIDYVVITHNHQDHCMFESLLQLRHKIKNVIVPKNNGGTLGDPSMKQVLQQIGFSSVKEIDEMESIEISGGDILGLPFFGEHADLNIKTKMAYLISLNKNLILCAADSENLVPELYKHIHHFTGDIDVLFIGMECDGAPLSWLYGPLLTRLLSRKVDQSRRSNGSNYAKAVALANQLNPKEVYVYAMGQEPWLTYLTSIQYTEESRPIIESNKLVEDCQKRGLVSERLYGQKEIILKSK